MLIDVVVYYTYNRTLESYFHKVCMLYTIKTMGFMGKVKLGLTTYERGF